MSNCTGITVSLGKETKTEKARNINDMERNKKERIRKVS